MANEFTQANTASRARLHEVASELTASDLALRTAYGWTVSALFAHVALWDQRVDVLLRRWKSNGVDESPVDSQMINDASQPLCHAIEPRAAVRLCLAAALETDAEIEATSDELIEEIQSNLGDFPFDRSVHRNEHLDDIEALVAAQGDKGSM